MVFVQHDPLKHSRQFSTNLQFNPLFSISCASLGSYTIGAPHFFLLYTSPDLLVSMHFLSVDSTHLCFTLYTVHGDVLVLNLVAGYCDNKESQIIAMARPKMWTQKHPCSHSVIMKSPAFTRSECSIVMKCSTSI